MWITLRAEEGAFSLTVSPTLIPHLTLPPQELLKDGKRETTISQLLINPTDLDIGRVFTCRSVNEAIPSGKETSIELDVHREQGPGVGWGGGWATCTLGGSTPWEAQKNPPGPQDRCSISLSSWIPCFEL